MELRKAVKDLEASDAVFNTLAKRERSRAKTDLRRLFNEASSQDKKLTEQAFIAVFKKLDELGVGRLIIGRRKNPNRFAWNYSLKDTAASVLQGTALTKNETEEIVEVPKKRGRPFGSKNQKMVFRKSRVVTDHPVEARVASGGPIMQMNIQLPENTRPEDVTAMLELIKGMAKK